jgi:hypothetical protein
MWCSAYCLLEWVNDQLLLARVSDFLCPYKPLLAADRLGCTLLLLSAQVAIYLNDKYELVSTSLSTCLRSATCVDTRGVDVASVISTPLLNPNVLPTLLTHKLSAMVLRTIETRIQCCAH